MFSLAETAIGMFEETDFVSKPDSQSSGTRTPTAHNEPLGSLEFTAVYSAAFYFMILRLCDNTQSKKLAIHRTAHFKCAQVNTFGPHGAKSILFHSPSSRAIFSSINTIAWQMTLLIAFSNCGDISLQRVKIKNAPPWVFLYLSFMSGPALIHLKLIL